MTDKVADKDYFLDEEGNVTDNEEKAATLLVRAGQEMSKEVADKVGAMPDKVAQDEADKVPGESIAEEKAAKPSSNKSAAPTKNKGAKK